MKAKCLNPSTSWICGTIRCKADGVISPNIVFSHQQAEDYFVRHFGSSVGRKFMLQNEISLPCGKCAACQIRKRKEMTVRLTNECSLYEDNCCFITLTYDDDHVPVTCLNPLNGQRPKMMSRGTSELPLMTLLPSDVQKFIKRLRRHLEYVPKRSQNIARDHVDQHIRYFAVGEYGGRYGRPHYHLLIFGWKPSDMVFFSERNGNVMYRSAQIEKLWKYGFSTVEPVGGGCARYCSRYVTKKFARLKDDNPFARCCFPEFSLQSVREGGIGAKWFDLNYQSMFERGFVNVRTGSNYVKFAIPQYYWMRCRKRDLCYWLQLRDERMQFARLDTSPCDLDRLIRSCNVYAFRERQLAQQELF